MMAVHTGCGADAHIQDVLDLLRRYVCSVQVSLVSCQGAEQHLHKVSLDEVSAWTVHTSTPPKHMRPQAACTLGVHATFCSGL